MFISHKVLSTALNFVSDDPTRGPLQGVNICRDADGNPFLMATSGHIALIVEWTEPDMPGIKNSGRDTWAPKNRVALGTLWPTELKAALKALKPNSKKPETDTLLLEGDMAKGMRISALDGTNTQALACHESETFPNIWQTIQRQAPKPGQDGRAPDGMATIIGFNPRYLQIVAEALVALDAPKVKQPRTEVTVPFNPVMPAVFRFSSWELGRKVTAVVMPMYR